MEILTPEQITKKSELKEGKERNKRIMENLEFLSEHDEEGVAFYRKRQEEISQKIKAQIHEIKSLNFEKIVNQHISYKVLENMISCVPVASEIFTDLRNHNEKTWQVLEKHVGKYKINLAQKQEEYINENNSLLADINKPLEIQEQKVIKLQDLLMLDEEFGPEYVELLNKESENLDEKEFKAQLLILDKCIDLVGNLPLSQKYQPALLELKNKLIELEDYDVRKEVNWEILPPGEVSVPAYYDKNGQGNKCFATFRNLARVELLTGFKPEKIYESKDSDKLRNYKAYVFPNCVVLCSEWSNQALYVLPRDNWQELSKKDKEELRFRGAIQLKNVGNWQDKLHSIIKGEMTIEVDTAAEFEPKPKRDWRGSAEQITPVIKEAVLKNYPDINEAMEAKNFPAAKELIKEIKYRDFIDLDLHGFVPKFNTFRESVMSAFPEVGLTEADFYVNIKKYKWRNKSEQEMIDNVKDAVFTNYPDIEAAIQKGDLETAKAWLTAFEDDDFIAIGLREITSGKTGSVKFNTRKKALLAAFAEILTEADFILAGKKQSKRYDSLEQRLSFWGKKIRGVFVKLCPEIDTLLEQGQFEKTKLLIITKIKESGGFRFFTERSEISSIRGIKEITGGMSKYLELAFPEIKWSRDFIISRNRAKVANTVQAQ